MITIHVKFLDSMFRGRDFQGEPEWPPSPARLFSALVAGAANAGVYEGEVLQAFDELEKAAPPDILTTDVLQASDLHIQPYMTVKPDTRTTGEKWKAHHKVRGPGSYPLVTSCDNVWYLVDVDEKWAPILDPAAAGVDNFGSAHDAADILVYPGVEGTEPATHSWRGFDSENGVTRMWYPGFRHELDQSYDTPGIHKPIDRRVVHYTTWDLDDDSSPYIPLVWEKTRTDFDNFDHTFGQVAKITEDCIPLVRADKKYGDGGLLGIAVPYDSAAAVLELGLGLYANPEETRYWANPSSYQSPSFMWRSVLPAMLPANRELAVAMAQHELSKTGHVLVACDALSHFSRGCAVRTSNTPGYQGYALTVYSPDSTAPTVLGHYAPIKD